VSAPTASPELGRLQRFAIVGAIVFLAVLGAGFFLNRPQFFRSYLLGWLFWVGMGVGCLGLAMLNHLTGGLWGLVPRRLHEAAARTLPAMGLLFVPSSSARPRSTSGRGPRPRPTRCCGRRPPT
jgi:hypothetical protein